MRNETTSLLREDALRRVLENPAPSPGGAGDGLPVTSMEAFVVRGEKAVPAVIHKQVTPLERTQRWTQEGTLVDLPGHWTLGTHLSSDKADALSFRWKF